MAVQEAIKKINVQGGIGQIKLLAQGPIKDFMAKEGTQLMVTACGEMAENLLSACRGAFSWWNLLQIPVELIVGKLMKNDGYTDLQAYAGKKAASFATAAGVGLIFGGPFGCLASIGFWIAAEVVSTLIKCLLAKAFGERFTSTFGESQTIELIKSIYRYFEMKVKGACDASLQWMQAYIESTQNRQKKLA